MEIILASKSPRRRELLARMGIKDFTVRPAQGEPDARGLEPGAAVELIAGAKAEQIASLTGGDAVIIAADTLVFLDGEAMGKPLDEQDAFRMLRELSGREHTVCTGVAVLRGEYRAVTHESTRVRFAEMSDDEIWAYVRSGEPMDKAGAYGAQGLGAVFIEGMDGDFFNVMGLPVHRLYKMLRDAGVSFDFSA
ncbi:MAG: septum formation protein Maf [Oscillospiraceae bacterium]|nr:septum formation protein Maf [Oscillospiraceae bacterium]